jgi:ADP-glucose pyrophosphorylase
VTQYRAQTLIGHIASSWNCLPRHLGEFVDVWPAQQRLHPNWYAGHRRCRIPEWLIRRFLAVIRHVAAVERAAVGVSSFA